MALDPGRAYSPGLISTQVLRECTREIAPILKRIYKSSINKGKVPNDWRTSDIVAVYRREVSASQLTTDRCH